MTRSRERLLGRLELLFELAGLVLQACGLLPVGLPRGLLECAASGVQLFLDLGDLVELLDLALPAGLELGGLLLRVGELLLELGKPLLRRLVLLLAQALALDLELHDPAAHLVELDGHARRFHAQLGGGLVDEVDGLVGQEPVGDIAVREDGGRDQRRVLDPDPVVLFVPLAQAAQDADRVRDGGLADVHRLEAALEGGVLLDVLAVLVEGRGADRVQLAARQHRLQHVRGVHRPLGSPRADDRVQLVDEEDDATGRVGDLLEDRLEPFLELAAILRPGHERAEIERDDPLVLQVLRDVAAHDALGQPFDDRGLAHARLADEHGVVLGPPAEDLDHAPDLLVAADDRIELALSGQRREVAAVLLERLVGRLGGRTRDPLAAADRLQALVQPVARDPEPPEGLPGRARLRVVGEGEQEVLGGDVVVLESLGLTGRRLEDAPKAIGGLDLRRTGATREATQGGLETLQDAPGRDLETLEDGRHDAVLLSDERVQEMLGLELRVVPFLGQPLRGDDRLLGLLGQLVHVHRHGMASWAVSGRVARRALCGAS